MKKVYATLYQIGTKLPKHHKLGIHANIERLALETIKGILEASLIPRNKKMEILEHVRINLELIKHLIRIEYELKIITEKQYIHTEEMLIETSKMTNGWIKYTTQNPAS